ncbi:MAG: hypothetical protein ABH811_02160 [archaeon]
MKRGNYFILILMIVLASGFVNAGNLINADSCSQVDVQAAIDAASAGDTVKVPAGSCVWDTKIDIIKGITLQGSGMDKTIITSDIPTAEGQSGKEAISVNVLGSTPWRITGFTFTDMGDYFNYAGFMLIKGSVNNWRLDHCKFLDTNYRGLSIQSGVYGLIDHCEFKDLLNQAIYIRPQSSEADEIWATETNLGGYDAVYIEDCVFNNTVHTKGALDGEYGAKSVFRHNSLTNMGLVAHGYEGDRSTLRLEIYDNILTAKDSEMLNTYVVALRGGTGIIYNNKITGKWLNVIMMKDYCACGDCVQGECTEYPCHDQIGRTSGEPYPNQPIEPIYQWDNTIDGKTVIGFVQDSCPEQEFSVGDAIQEGRDYYDNQQKSGYTPYKYPHPLTIAPFGTDICGEGEITTECWCEGLKTTGTCNNGYFSGGSSCIHASDTNCDGKVDIKELIFFITKYNNGEVAISELTSAIDVWKGF